MFKFIKNFFRGIAKKVNAMCYKRMASGKTGMITNIATFLYVKTSKYCAEPIEEFEEIQPADIDTNVSMDDLSDDDMMVDDEIESDDTIVMSEEEIMDEIKKTSSTPESFSFEELGLNYEIEPNTVGARVNDIKESASGFFKTAATVLVGFVIGFLGMFAVKKFVMA